MLKMVNQSGVISYLQGSIIQLTFGFMSAETRYLESAFGGREGLGGLTRESSYRLLYRGGGGEGAFYCVKIRGFCPT